MTLEEVVLKKCNFGKREKDKFYVRRTYDRDVDALTQHKDPSEAIKSLVSLVETFDKNNSGSVVMFKNFVYNEILCVKF